MSIITDTLNRLEADSTTPTRSLDDPGLPTAVNSSMGFPVKALMVSMLLFFAGTGAVVWYLGDRVDGAVRPSLAKVDNQAAAEKAVAHQPLPLPLEEPPADLAIAKPREVMPEREVIAAVEQPVIDSVIEPAAAVSEPAAAVAPETDKPQLQAEEESPRPAPAMAEEKPVVAAKVEPAVAPVIKPVEAAAEADKQPVQAIAESPRPTPTPVEEKPVVVAKAEPAVAPESKPVKPAAVTEKQAVPAKVETPRPVPAEEKPVVVAKVEPAVAKKKKAPAAKSKPVPVASDKPQQSAAAAPAPKKVSSGSVDKAVEQAQLALSRGEYAAALDALEALSSAPERRADFWLMKGSAHLGLGQLEAAEKAFETAQPLAPNNVNIAVQLAILKQEMGDHPAALQILKDAAARHPSVPEIFLNQGFSEQELGAVQDAKRSFRIFLRLTEGRSLYAEQRQLVNEWLAQF